MNEFWRSAIAGLSGLAFVLGASMPSIAQKNSYSVGTRATFLAGCLNDEPPDYSDNVAVLQKMQLCVCLLDRFQDEYTNAQFTQLFTNLDRKQPKAEKEVDDFLIRHATDCL